MAWVLWKGKKEEVEVDGVVLCSLLQVCRLIRKHAVLQGSGLSIGQGNAAFAVTLVQSCGWGRAASLIILSS